MSQASRRRRASAFVASTALMASLLPTSTLPAAAATAQARTITDGCPDQRVPDAGFNDTNGHIFELEINCVAWYGITSGRADGGYGPSAAVTRGAMSAFLVRLIEATGQLVDPTPPSAFDDVVGHTFEKAINQLAGLGVVQGFRDSDDVDNDGDTDELIFKPNQAVSRAQMATFINAAHGAMTGVRVSSADDFFSDDDGTAHEANINAMASVGVASGISTTQYGGSRKVTRGAMAAFLSRQVDYLVEIDYLNPPIDGFADVVLDSLQINQGRQAIGSILSDGIPIASATVDICDGAFGTDVNMNEDNFAFAFTIPFQANVGLCTLTFDIVLGNNQHEIESQVIEIVKTNKVLLGPELVSIEILNVGADTATIRYEFAATTDLNEAVEASKFRLYGFAGQQFSAITAFRTGNASVEATFSRDQYDEATTGGIAQFAVQDQNGFQVAEYAFGLKDVRLNAGETQFPDLLSVTGTGGNALTFTFDALVFEVAPADFAAVYSSNGVTASVSGDAIISGGPGSTSFTVNFTPPEGGGVILRGVIKTNSIAAAGGGTEGNPRQAEDVAGPTQSSSPHLTSMILDQANNQVQYIFSEAVTNNAQEADDGGPFCPIMCSPTPGVGFQIYDITGQTFTTTTVVQGSNNTLIAQYAAGQVTGLIQGGSSDQGVAIAQRNSALHSGVDEIGRQNTFEAGHTAAPDLLKVNKVTDAEGALRLTYTFDQSVALTTGNPIGDFLLYTQDNTRKVVDRSECTAEGVTVTCIIKAASEDFQFASSAVYASVSYAAVNAGGNSKYNPEGGFALGGA